KGSFPYVSPEQTGRVNRDLDYRSDYYSLGVTLFELLTGRLPFEASTPLEWVHRHISQLPPPASRFRSDVPPALDGVLLRLLAKDADDRYQSTYGLVRDLERCRVDPSFPLGQHDAPRRFQVPRRLFGREAELSRLYDAFGSVASGRSAFVTVSGWSGVGKSALVMELGRSIVGARGRLLEGKFDQFQQGTPYHALVAAMRGLARQLQAEPEAVLDALRADLVERLGANARLIVDLVPELSLVLGEPPPVVALPPVEAQNRLQLAVVDFLGAFTSTPLVLFFDDLQWSDVPTLRLLRRIATTRALTRILVVATYRSNHVDAAHPLTLALEEIREQREIVAIELLPLDRRAVRALVAATVGDHPETDALASVLADRTGGNAFYVTRLLERFWSTGLLRFDPDAGRWRWDADAVAAADAGESVVHLLVDELRRLPGGVGDTLRLAACIGNTFDLRTLAAVCEAPESDVAADLLAAMKRDLVAPLSEDYALAGASDVAVAYRFQHDRV
ncbi:MAG: AAA family ATPase, partial [Myxococcales bacterium]|nr:AAA family ATPase [Myxococcales bacterium]